MPKERTTASAITVERGGMRRKSKREGCGGERKDKMVRWQVRETSILAFSYNQ